MEKKLCMGPCGKKKLITEFHRRGPNGYQSWCKLCRKVDDGARYLATSEYHAKVRRSREAELAAWAQSLKEKRPCVDCGHSFHPVVMQWDHTGTDKKINISDAVKRGWSKAHILAEIAKCELVCANCHALRTWLRGRKRAIAQFG
jgi:hypothetical protein